MKEEEGRPILESETCMTTITLIVAVNDNARPNGSSRERLSLFLPLIDLLALQIAREEIERLTAANDNDPGPHAAP